MKYRCYVDNRKGEVWQIPFIDVKWHTKQNGEAGTLSFSFLRDIDFEVLEGHTVNFALDGQKIFAGYIFDVERDESEKVSCTAYDQLQYLHKNKGTYSFKNKTASQILEQLCKEHGLQTGEISDTGYAMNLIAQDKALDAIVVEALDRTLSEKRRFYTLFDDAGKISLLDIEQMRTDLILGDGALLTGYKHKRSIAEDVYNAVRLTRKNEETGITDVFEARDYANIEKWGALQYSQAVDEGLNDAQIQQRLELMMKLKNRVLRTFSLNALGALEARAGASIGLSIEREAMQSWFVISSAEHHFENNLHTMKLDLFMPDQMEETEASITRF